MKNQVSYSSEIREQAVRLVFQQPKEHESQWSTIGCTARDVASVGKTNRDRPVSPYSGIIRHDKPHYLMAETLCREPTRYYVRY